MLSFSIMAIGFGSIISAVGHGGLLIGVLMILGNPRPFEAPPQDAIAVDIVTPKEVETAQVRGTPPPDPKALTQPPPERGLQPSRDAQAPPPSGAVPPQQTGDKSPAEATAAREAETQSAPVLLATDIDSAELLALYNMRTPGSGFDAPAESRADLSSADAARFKRELRRCWELPPGLAGSATRVVLRLQLNIDGTLASEPMLVEASASKDGPRVLRAATEAVERCQPFTALPRERYREWKQIDVSFSPLEMAGQ